MGGDVYFFLITPDFTRVLDGKKISLALDGKEIMLKITGFIIGNEIHILGDLCVMDPVTEWRTIKPFIIDMTKFIKEMIDKGAWRGVVEAVKE